MTQHTGPGRVQSHNLNAKGFLSLSRMLISVFEVMSIYMIDRYQNAIPRAMPLHELKKVQLQERFTLMTHDSIGHLKTLNMSLSLLSCSDSNPVIRTYRMCSVKCAEAAWNYKSGRHMHYKLPAFILN